MVQRAQGQNKKKQKQKNETNIYYHTFHSVPYKP